MPGYDYLIVGGGMVADAAARGIRELDARGSIGILSADVEPPYARPALSKKLWTDPDFTWDQVPLGTVEATGAELVLDTVVTGIDREARWVSTASGDVVEYGRLLLATGSVPHHLDAPEDERIIHFRSAADYRTLRDQLRNGTRVIVVGGGYIGAELAAALVKNEARVTLVHPDRVLGESVFPGAIADRYERMFADAGVVLIPGRRAERAQPMESGIVVTLDDGSAAEGDLLVVGLGVSPVVDIAEQAGLAVEDGVLVDEFLRTTDESIWAAGDIALYPDPILGRTRVEHVDNATSMGSAAGRSMAGERTPYSHTPFFYSQVFGVRWEAVGELDTRLETLEDWVVPEEKAVVYYLDGEAPVGVLLWDVAEATDEARAVLADPPSNREELLGRITVDA